MKINNPKGHELVAEELLRRIREGEWQPGHRLPSVVELGELFGVGRSTIREAVSALKAMGWLDVRHGGGTFVQSTLPSSGAASADSLFQDADSLIELLEVRKVLEVGAASLAAQKRSEADLLRLREGLTVMERSLQQHETTEGERADAEFHLAIAAASGNSLLMKLMDSLSDRLLGSMRQTRELWFYEQQATASRLMQEHRALYEAIEQQDSKQAGELAADHLTKVERVLREALARPER